jgi:hypothetical protein
MGEGGVLSITTALRSYTSKTIHLWIDYLSMALQPFVGRWPLFSFLVLYTVGRTPRTGDQPVARPLSAHTTRQTQNKRTYTSMPRVGFEPKIPVFERRRLFMPWIARPLWSVLDRLTKSNLSKAYRRDSQFCEIRLGIWQNTEQAADCLEAWGTSSPTFTLPSPLDC